MIVLGIGNLGRALVANGQFREQGFHVVAGFDVDTNVVGIKAESVKVV